MIDWDLEELTLTELLEIEMVNECYFRGVHCHVARRTYCQIIEDFLHEITIEPMNDLWFSQSL